MSTPSPAPPPADRPPRSPWRTALLVGALVFYVASGLGPGVFKVWSSTAARDYATYHYAVQEAVSGGDPYNTQALGKRARDEGTRRGVHPYFYPPPFLASMLWAAPLSLATGYRLFFLLNNLLLVGIVVALQRWLRASWLPLVLAAATLTPIADSNVMGQANLLVMLLVVLGLGRGDGRLLGLAAMFKMSPALYLVRWAAGGRLKAVFAACVVAVVSSVLVLPLVGLDTQLRFYTEILPGFGSGEYHGLRVPITLPANHSIPDLFHQLWPGPDDHHLSPAARRASQAVSLSLLGGLGWLSWRLRSGEALTDALLLGAFTVLLTITPVYTYEHHLSALVLPGAALFVAMERGRLSARWWLALGPCWFFVAWKLRWLRTVQDWLPGLDWVLQESKFVGAVGLGMLCVVAALRGVEESPPPVESREEQQARLAAELQALQERQQARKREQQKERQAAQQSLFPVDIRKRGASARGEE